MRGTGGPLLCIGDLLCDIGEEEEEEEKEIHETPKSSSSSASISILPHFSPSLDLTHLFQENYDQLNKSFDGNDQSWTGLTLKMCSALETASELVESTNSNSRFLLEKIVEFEKTLKKGDSTIEAAKAIHHALNQKHPFSPQITPQDQG